MTLRATQDEGGFWQRPSVRFGVDDADLAANTWGFNCGPGALCAVLGRTPAEIRPLMLDFEKKGYTNPTLMFDILRGAGVGFESVYRSDDPRGVCPLTFGLMRVQWGGPWTRPGVPMRARYRHTHWVAVDSTVEDLEVFDINAACVGGWLGGKEWAEQLVPWLLEEIEPQSDGRWWPTHGIEIRGLP